MSQQQSFPDTGISPITSGVETLTGNDGLPVSGSGSPININILGDTVQGVSVDRTAADTETITVADATTTQKGVVTLPTQEVAVNYTNVTFAMSPYTVTDTDYFLSVDSSGGPVTINLPDSTTNYRQFIVKDRLGQATTNNITIKSLSGVTKVDQQNSYVFVDNFESFECLYFSANYEVY